MKKEKSGPKAAKVETDMRKDFPSLGYLFRALSEGQFKIAIGAMKGLTAEIGKKSPEVARVVQEDRAGRIGQMLEELEEAKEPLTFIVEVHQGGGSVKAPYMAAETFCVMAGKALDAINEAVKFGNMGLKEAGEEVSHE